MKDMLGQELVEGEDHRIMALDMTDAIMERTKEKADV